MKDLKVQKGGYRPLDQYRNQQLEINVLEESAKIWREPDMILLAIPEDGRLGVGEKKI